MNHLAVEEIKETLQNQPYSIVEKGKTQITILGTAHVSKTSAEVVKELIDSNHFDIVAVELDSARYEAITDKNRYRSMDLVSIIKNRQTGLVATNLALSAYQKRLADQLGVEPGAEMKQAIDSARKKSLTLWCIDRNVSTTMKRTWHGLSFLEKANLIFGFGGFFDKQEISEEEIEKLKTGDMLESTFSDFAENSQSIYSSLIDERDRYMAAQILKNIDISEKKNILVIIGAGHMKGLTQYLNTDFPIDETIKDLDTIPEKKSWIKYLPWVITALIIIGFIWGFSINENIGWEMIKTWVLYNGVLSALGALIAGGHLVTVISAFVAAPLTSLNPTVGAGMVTALVETHMRKPKVQDFEELQYDSMSFKGWWKNPVTRILLVFIFSTVGSALGTWISGFKIFNQLV